MKVLIALTALATTVLVHDHERPDLDTWFKGLQNQKAEFCCAGDEAKRAASAWDMKKGHYIVEIEIGGKSDWYDVPNQALVKGPNWSGHALVWWIPNNTFGLTMPEIRCFMPGTGG